MAPKPGSMQPDRMSGINGKLKSSSGKNFPKQTAAKKMDSVKGKPISKKPAERMSGAKLKKY